MTDTVAKLFLRWSSKTLQAVDAALLYRCGGRHPLTINSSATSLKRQRLQRSALVGWIVLWRENYRRPISDFCNNIDPKRTLAGPAFAYRDLWIVAVAASLFRFDIG